MKEQLYQVWATDTATGQLIPIFPKATKEAVEQWVSVVNEQIRLGKCKALSDPHVAAHIDIAA